MKSGTTSLGVLALSSVIVFTIVTAVLFAVFPESQRPIDYVAIGSVAVMLSILTAYSLTVSKADSTPRRRPAAARRKGYVLLNLDAQNAAG